MRLTSIVIALVALLAFPVNAEECSKAHTQMLEPAVLVDTGMGSGSGTVIHSSSENGNWQTFVLTNHHVIRAAISTEEKWDAEQGRDVKVEIRTPVNVQWYEYNDCSRYVGTYGQRADIVAYDRNADLALLQLRNNRRGVSAVANVIPESGRLTLAEPVWAVGAGLGKPPFMTDGTISNLDTMHQNYRYMLATAPIIFGNSGGALYHWSDERDRYELIGVPSRVSIAGWTSVVTHMAWSVPMDTVRGFLTENEYGHILEDRTE